MLVLNDIYTDTIGKPIDYYINIINKVSTFINKLLYCKEVVGIYFVNTSDTINVKFNTITDLSEHAKLLANLYDDMNSMLPIKSITDHDRLQEVTNTLQSLKDTKNEVYRLISNLAKPNLSK